MPEGPSILIFKEAIAPQFKGKIIDKASGNADIDMSLLLGEKIKDVKTFGKHLLICLPNATIRIHFLMFGAYTINEQIRTPRSLRLKLVCGKQTLYFYTCAVKWLPGKIKDYYDWRIDTLSAKYDPVFVRKKVKEFPDEQVCDVLLNQDVFAGVGNIIKNEVLFRIKLHPKTRISKIPPRKLTELISQARTYSFDFLKWRKAMTLKKHWLAHTKKICPRCDIPFKKEYCGKTKRRTFYCENCQQ